MPGGVSKATTKAAHVSWLTQHLFGRPGKRKLIYEGIDHLLLCHDGKGGRAKSKQNRVNVVKF